MRYRGEDVLTIGEIAERFERYARVERRPLFVMGMDEMPGDGVPLPQVDRCVAKALLTAAADRAVPPLVIGADLREGCCPGGLTWLGLAPRSPKLAYFVPTGTPDFRHGEAEHLKHSPEAAERFFRAPGTITPPGRYLVVAGADQVRDESTVRSLLVLGTAEQVRNLGGLVHYRQEDIFRAVLMPGGPTCSSMITYAAGMASEAPRDTAFVGPVDPTGNAWFPRDAMSFAAPIGLARQMAEDMPGSFLGRRAEVAFPARPSAASRPR